MARLMLLMSAMLVAVVARAAEPVTLTTADQAGHPVLKLSNHRVALVIDPTRGGAVTSYSDKLAPAELILQQQFNGLCLDHFQEQSWPGEFLEQPYEFKVLQQTPDVAQVVVWRKASGVWRGKLADPKLADLLIEKTYTLRADSPVLTCEVKLTAPPDASKVFSYWLQDVMFAGGDYDPVADRTFRPSVRGIRSTSRDDNSHYGREEWLRDFTGGWMALVDTKKQSGLVLSADYNDVRISYACGGNMTNELMFNTTYLPKGASRTYQVELIPVVGLDRVLSAGPEAVLSYGIKPAAGGKGQLEFRAVRAAQAVSELALDVTLVSGMEPTQQVKAGRVSFGALSDRAEAKPLDYTGAPPDPIVIRVAIGGKHADGSAFSGQAEDFFPGSYKWADNIQTDMRTPVYQAERPAQVLKLAKPEKLVVTRPYNDHYLYFQGLHDEDYNLAAAVHLTGWEQQSDLINYSWDSSWYGALSDFPYDYDKLLSYHAVILGGASRSGLKAIGLEMLHDYLLAGGGVLVLGSHGAYGKSQLRGTALGDALPVEIPDTRFSLQATGGQPVSFGPERPEFLKYDHLSPQATCYFRQNVTVRPGARVVMQVGGQPFLVLGEYGPNQARIACLLGAPLGAPQAGQTPFWRDPGWILILRNTLWWLARHDDLFQE